MAYPYQCVKYQGKKHDIHRLMMEQYLGRKLTRKQVVHHKDGNKRHNEMKNFEVKPLSRHSRDHGREIRSGAKLTPSQVWEIRKLFRETELSYAAIGRIFNVSREAIKGIKLRRTWGWLRSKSQS